MKFQNPSYKFFLNGRKSGQTNKRRTSRKQYAPHFFKVGGIIKLISFDVAIYEPRFEKTGFMHMRKQRRRSASQ